jgi:hypothetical protein
MGYKCVELRVKYVELIHFFNPVACFRYQAKDLSAPSYHIVTLWSLKTEEKREKSKWPGEVGRNTMFKEGTQKNFPNWRFQGSARTSF